MDEIPTAEEFLKKWQDSFLTSKPVITESLKKQFIEFTKLHVEAALKEASEKYQVEFVKLRKDETAIIRPYKESVEEAAETVLKKQSWDTSLDLPFNNGFLKGFELGAEWQKNQK